MGFSSARNLGRDISAGFSPPRRMPISEAVKKFMRVPKGAGNSVPWDPELTPYIIEPMNCLASREYDAVIFVGPARTGKTIGLIDGWIVYTIVCDPSDMLVVQMTEDKAREHSKKRLDRTFRSSAAVSGRQMETKEVDAERMLHLKFVRRLHQMRGTSLLSGVLIRLSALKEYEDSELTAARIAAALGMYIRKGDGQSYEADGNGSKDKERELTIQPGIIYDDLKPGEEIGMVKSDRPNPNLETFRNGQLRAVAAGSRLSFSSTARNYNGTYSAQRQELVESTDGYLILQDWFIGAVTRPMYRAWLKQAVASGVIRLPRDLDRSSLYTAVYSGPVMPWIDPVKEAEAWKIQIRGGAATESDWVRAGGRNPDDVKRRRKAEIDENRKLDLVFDTDPASDKGGSSAATKRQEPQHTDDQSEE